MYCTFPRPALTKPSNGLPIQKKRGSLEKTLKSLTSNKYKYNEFRNGPNITMNQHYFLFWTIKVFRKIFHTQSTQSEQTDFHNV
jgi:hypothetical protein